MIAVDTNILVYGHSEDSQFYETVSEILRRLAESPIDGAITLALCA